MVVMQLKSELLALNLSLRLLISFVFKTSLLNPTFLSLIYAGAELCLRIQLFPLPDLQIWSQNVEIRN